ncbi:MAG: metal-dependent transcriptional regulator, partial [Phycisphaerales bacterium]
MASSTVEDYVKAIYLLQQDAPTGEATVARLAATLGVTKGSVTAMVRKLRDARLANAKRYGGIALTPRGRTLAIDMIRRHRLIEVFLVETLGFDWSEVHEEAERLEHALSAKVLDRLDAFL